MRMEKAEELKNAVEKELREVGMPGARFEVRVESLVSQGPDVYTQWGADKVEFVFSANPDVPLMPLSRTASGGELARIYLALKSVTAGGGEILIFDEVDAGIGGVTADVVADKLKEISRTRQVFLITHRAQIAAKADGHFAVKKSVKGDRTQVEVKKLTSPEERVEELARLLSGEVTPISLQHAEELVSTRGSRKKGSRAHT